MEELCRAPVLLVIFNRPENTQHVFNQIKAAKPKKLYIAADGPRPGNPNDTILCRQARQVVNQVDWNCKVTTLFREENIGCGLGVSSAISWFFEQEDEGIILEDDCLPELSFFRFCSELLTKYKEDEEIYLISGTKRQNEIPWSSSGYFFSNYPVTWGWATWRRAWQKFNFEIPDVDRTFASGSLDHIFQSKKEKFYWKKKMKMIEKEKKNIWDYQWRFAIWKNKGIGITPNTNLIINLGFVNSATHTFLNDSFRQPSKSSSLSFPLDNPNKVVDRKADMLIFKNSFSHSPQRLYRLLQENGIKRILKYSLAKLL